MEAPGISNSTTFRIDENELSMTWAHHSVRTSAGSPGVESQLSLFFSVDEITPYRIEGVFESELAGLYQYRLGMDLAYGATYNEPIFRHTVSHRGPALPEYNGALDSPLQGVVPLQPLSSGTLRPAEPVLRIAHWGPRAGPLLQTRFL